MNAMPILAITRVCKVRTYRSRYERLDWLQLFCAGLADFGARAW